MVAPPLLPYATFSGALAQMVLVRVFVGTAT